jgi:hypothetical protein
MHHQLAEICSEIRVQKGERTILLYGWYEKLNHKLDISNIHSTYSAEECVFEIKK